MDANGQRFWLLADAADFRCEDGRALWDRSRRVLRLASLRQGGGWPTDREEARLVADGAASTLDATGTWAVVTPGLAAVDAFGAFDDPSTIYKAPGAETILDIAMGQDDILYLCVGQVGGPSSVVMVDRRNRWDPVTLSHPRFSPDRLCVAAEGGVWLLDRRRRKLGRVRGAPARRGVLRGAAAGTFRPCCEEPEAPAIHPLPEVALPLRVSPVAIASSLDGRVAILAWPNPRGEAAHIYMFDGRSLSAPRKLGGAVAPISVGWVEGDRWAVIFAGGMQEAVCYEVPPPGNPDSMQLEPLGDRYPLDGTGIGRFCNAATSPVHYLGERDVMHRPIPLHRLSMPSLATTATVAARRFDSQENGTAWHRIYMEASIPQGCGVRLFLSAADTPEGLGAAPEAPHRFGSMGDAAAPDEAVGAWLPVPSEIPFHQGLLPCAPIANRCGLFTVLAQRPGTLVRTLRGRFLQARVELHGTGHATPEVAAIRIYAPRFSYLDRYLPELYRETLLGPGGEEQGGATGPDFLQRFLALFEGVLTPIEDRVADAHLVTVPETAPAEALPWLAGWIGLAMEAALPVARQRRMIREATALYRRRGTLSGLAGSLDVVSGGMVARKEIVILEDFRLRRTFATVLGADLADEDDPLLAGIVESGNSYVGKTLFLGDESKKEFLALFDPDAVLTRREGEAVEEILDRLAYRVTVIVNRDVGGDDLRLIRRVVTLETPAHVEPRIVQASRGLILGLASLVGIDTKPGSKPPKLPVRVARSVIGRRDFIIGRGSLDPRLDSGGDLPDNRPPEARALDATAAYGMSVTLDASGSVAFGNRRIVSYTWKLRS